MINILKATKKPVTIEAAQFTGNNSEEDESLMYQIVGWISANTEEQAIPSGKPPAYHDGTSIFINTLEGEMRADVGDYIIKGVKGEFYPCKPDIFEQTYNTETKKTGLSFGEALNLMQNHDKAVKREGWNGKDQNVFWWFGEPDCFEEPHAVLKNQQGKFIPWLPSQGDLSAMDWEVTE